MILAAWRDADRVERVRWLLLVFMVVAWVYAADTAANSRAELQGKYFEGFLDAGGDPCRVPATYRNEHGCTTLEEGFNMSVEDENITWSVE